MLFSLFVCFFFFFNDTATTEIYTLSLHDALPISCNFFAVRPGLTVTYARNEATLRELERSEEHTSELQSQSNLVCRLLLEKKKKNKPNMIHQHVDINHYNTPNMVCTYHTYWYSSS